MSAPRDLDACASEPIHIPGAIQPHGALLGVEEPDLRIVLASENAPQVLDDDAVAVGEPLAAFVDRPSLRRLRLALEGDPRDANPLDVRLRNGRGVHVLAHRSEGLLLLEVEPAGTDPTTFRSAYRRLVRRFERLRRATSVSDVCEIAVTEVQALTGFERVMVYRFDTHANGQVIAECRVDETLEPYLGLHYPASDIPAQARRLYVRNPIRLIVDAAYEPVPLCPDHNPLTGAPLDLSQAGLRSVSPVHCEYLLNMGVRSSMSISLLEGDDLWGLVACHHREPRQLAYSTRLVAEFLAQVLSAKVTELERVDALARKTAAYGVQSRLIDRMVASPRFQDGLTGDDTSLLDLIPCDGAAVLYRGELTCLGETPAATEIRDLGAALAKAGPGEVVATDRLATLHPPAAGYAPVAAGAIAVPLSADAQDLIFWFRAEHVRSVTWAGNPDKATIDSRDGRRLGPRRSFAAWVSEVRGQSRPWKDWEVEVASDFRTALAASIIHQAAELERLNAKLLEAGEQKDRFLAVASHELRNPLNAILGWVRLMRMGMNPDDLAVALETVERNARAQADLLDDLLDVSRIEAGRLQLEMAPLNLAHVVRDALGTVEPVARERRVLIDSRLDEDCAYVVGDGRRLQQVVWNLLTNAIKFSADGSRIEVTLAPAGSSLGLEVRDQGIGLDPTLIPHIFEPFRQGEGPGQRLGLGLGLSIVKNIVELHGGHVSAHSDGPGTGSRFRVSLPVAALRNAGSDADMSLGRVPIDLAGLRLLVAEDHPDAAEMVASMLVGYGADVIVVHDGREALEWLRGADGRRVDLVISDLEMPHLDGFGLLGEMRTEPALAGIPAIALTAFSRGGDRARAIARGFRHHVAKPVDPEELVTVVAMVLDRLR